MSTARSPINGLKPEDEVLSNAAIDVLRNTHTRRIRFQFKTIHGSDLKVDASTFERVAKGIEQSMKPYPRDSANTVHVKIGHKMGTEYGSYEGRWNTYTLRTNYGSRDWQATVVHEAVHASLDLTRSVVTAVDNETAAFIASAIYLLMVGMPLTRLAGLYENDLRDAAREAMRTGKVSTNVVRKFRHLLRVNDYGDGELFETNVKGERHLKIDRGDG